MKWNEHVFIFYRNSYKADNLLEERLILSSTDSNIIQILLLSFTYIHCLYAQVYRLCKPSKMSIFILIFIFKEI